MLKMLLVVAGTAAALALMAPDYLLRQAAREQAKAPSARPTEKLAALDIGGVERIAADRRGHFITGIEVNNRRLQALVDTGASVIALRYEDARALGLVSPGDRFEVAVRTANGIARAKRVELLSVRLGTITVRNVDALVSEQGALATNLLGMSFLRRLSRFEIERGTLILER